MSGKSHIIAKTSVSPEYEDNAPYEERSESQMMSFCRLDESSENQERLGKG
jgi:predicted transposase YdaD